MLELHEGAEGQGLGGWPLWGRLPACGQPSTALPPGGALGYPSASVAPPPRTRPRRPAWSSPPLAAGHRDRPEPRSGPAYLLGLWSSRVTAS